MPTQHPLCHDIGTAGLAPLPPPLSSDRIHKAPYLVQLAGKTLPAYFGEQIEVDHEEQPLRTWEMQTEPAIFRRRTLGLLLGPALAGAREEELLAARRLHFAEHFGGPQW